MRSGEVIRSLRERSALKGTAKMDHRPNPFQPPNAFEAMSGQGDIRPEDRATIWLFVAARLDDFTDNLII